MAQLDLSTEVGRLIVRARDEDLAAAALEPALAAFLEGRSVGLSVELCGRPGWLKGGPPRGSAALRYGLRWRLARRAPPRGREYANLSWLEARLFRVAAPLACGWILRGARLRFQFLVTALSEDARPLESILDESTPSERAGLVDELARESARMHALSFVHRDLYLRNVLVLPAHVGPGDPRRLVFIDAWRGGPHHVGRGPAYDLGCLMLEGASVLTREEQARFVHGYLEERSGQGKPARAQSLLRSAERARASLLARARREPGRWRLDEPPAPNWDGRGLIV